jgi:hypothetical protein
METIFEAIWCDIEEWGAVHIFRAGPYIWLHSYGQHGLAGGDYDHTEIVTEDEAIQMMIDHEQEESY